MSDKYILKDKKVIPVDDVLEWGKWFETANRIVAVTDLPNGYFVSTVFLGLDHSFGRGKPLLFETMVFKGSKDDEGFDGADQDGNRYSTWEQAEKGHQEMVKKWKAMPKRHSF